MRIAVYAIRTSEKWKCYLSLDMRVDTRWWCEVNRWTDEKTSAFSLVLLSTQVPLGWAVFIQERFRSIQDMDQWGKSDWHKYLYQSLAPFLLQEPEGSRSQWSVLFKEIQMLDGSYVNYSIVDWNEAEVWGLLMQQAELLIQSMAGRALLAGEVEALLAEVSGGDTGDWRSVAQLGVLLGRLRLEAGLAQPAPLRRRATAPRCRRCGSEARSRTACAACGSAACAYCEACLAMG
ncbi:DNA/RNA helicase, partial [Paenibacillus sp. p3-SID867]|nr:DNA/RNA helicase [Paenibacillus sp. p3-SID867]